MVKLWHAAYKRWFDNNQAGNHKRASMWGQFADLLARWA
jgi:hypothetical protein